MELTTQLMHKLSKIIILCLPVFLFGCSSIEYRSEAPKRTPLLPLTEISVSAKKTWSTSVGNGAKLGNVKLLLAQADDVLFTADTNGLVVALDRLTGHKNWSKALKMPISAGPAVGEKIVVVCGNAQVIALDNENGNVLWQTAVTSEALAAPKIDENIVLINTLDGGLTALSAQDGHQLWRFVLSPPSLVLRRTSVPAVTKDYIIAGFASGRIVAINRLDGSVDWAADVSAPQGRSDIQRMIDISADPVVDEDIVYVVNYQGNVSALALHTGQIIWEREASSYAGLLVDRHNVYVAATNGDVLAFDKHTGTALWVQTELHGRELSKPVLQGGQYIVIADDEGYLHWLDRKHGQLQGRYRFTSGAGGIEAPPLVYADLLYVYARNGQVGEINVDLN